MTEAFDKTSFRGGFAHPGTIEGEPGSVLELRFTGTGQADAALQEIRRLLELPIAFTRDTGGPSYGLQRSL